MYKTYININNKYFSNEKLKLQYKKIKRIFSFLKVSNGIIFF